MFTQGYTNIPREWLVWEWLLNWSWADTAWVNTWTPVNTTWSSSEKWYVQQTSVLNGTNAYVSTNYPLQAASSTSMAVWIKWNWKVTEYNAIMADHTSSATPYNYNLLHNSNADKTIQCQIYWKWTISWTTVLNANQWYFVVMTHNTSTWDAIIYLDWIQDWILSTWTPSTQTWGWLNIGRAWDYNGRYFGWNIWLARVYNRVLSEDEIYNLYLEGMRRLWDRASYPALMNWLVAYYDFKGDANDVWWGNNGTVSGASLTTDHLGRSNSAYSFDGVNDWITTWGNLWITSFPISISSTFKFNWARLELLSWSTASGYYWVNIAALSDGSIFVTYWDGTWGGSSDRKSFQSATWIFTTWNWYNIQIVCTDFNTVTMYVNWTQYSVTYSSWTATSINFSWATYSIWQTLLWPIYWNWTIASIFVQNKALSLSEWQVINILSNKDYIYPFSKGSTLWLQDWLIMHLDWDGNDLSGNGNGGSPVNWPTKIRKNQSSGLQYTSTLNQYIPTWLTATSNFTFDAIINAYSNPENWEVMAKYDGSAKIWQLYLYNVDSKLYLNYWSVTWTRVTVTSNTVFSFNKQYRVTVSYDWTTTKMYINWVLESSSTTTPSDWIDTIPFDISSRNSDGRTVRNWNWEIFEPRYWNKALSDKEIEQLHYLTYLN